MIHNITCSKAHNPILGNLHLYLVDPVVQGHTACQALLKQGDFDRAYNVVTVAELPLVPFFEGLGSSWARERPSTHSDTTWMTVTRDIILLCFKLSSGK